MNTIITSIQEEATKKGISVWKVVEEIKLQLQIAEDKEKDKEQEKAFFDEVRKDISESKSIFLDKKDRMTLWFAYSKEDLKKDRFGDVCLKPFDYDEHSYIPKKNLHPITKEDALQLLPHLLWKSHSSHEPSDEYTRLANELLAKEAQ